MAKALLAYHTNSSIVTDPNTMGVGSAVLYTLEAGVEFRLKAAFGRLLVSPNMDYAADAAHLNPDLRDSGTRDGK